MEEINHLAPLLGDGGRKAVSGKLITRHAPPRLSGEADFAHPAELCQRIPRKAFGECGLPLERPGLLLVDMVGKGAVIDHGGIVRQLLLHFQEALLQIGHSGSARVVLLQAAGYLAKGQGPGVQPRLHLREAHRHAAGIDGELLEGRRFLLRDLPAVRYPVTQRHAEIAHLRQKLMDTSELSAVEGELLQAALGAAGLPP